jgi:ABC-type branched-subunit amino acid transport system substrate-binding protein
MMYLRRLCIALVVIGGYSVGLVTAQESLEYSDVAEKIFLKGVSSFAAGNYEDAVPMFDQVIRDMPFNQRTTGAILMKAKALYRLHQELEAARLLTRFIAEYPMSSYVPDAYYTIGLTQVHVRRYDDAVNFFLSAMRSLPPPPRLVKLQDEIINALDATINQHLSKTAVQLLLHNSRTPDERMFLWLKLGEKEAASGSVASAMIALDTLTVRYPANPYSKRIDALRQRIQQRSSVKLGVVLPLMTKSPSSPLKDIAVEVYEGIELALERYAANPDTRVAVSLETRDTERDPLLASKSVQDMLADSAIIGVIGPIFSNTTIAAATVANAGGTPLVTPTANSNGIAAIGPYIFQANADYQTRGMAMAQYAVRGKGFKTVAILAPVDSYGKFMAEAFAAEVVRLGGRVISQQGYPRGTSDLKAQIASIRKAGMLEGAEPYISFAGRLNRGDIAKLVQLGVPTRTLDSLIEHASIFNAARLLGPNAKGKIDSLGIAAFYANPQIDSLEYPVTSVDAIYLPISGPEEIGVVSSQLVYFNFQTHLLGSGEWNSVTELHANRRYCDSVAFESDNFPDTTTAAYADFLRSFTERFKKQPGRNTLYGYDVAALVLSLIHSGATTREALKYALSGVTDYQGVHSRIGFSMKRVNPWVYVLQYAADGVTRIRELNTELGESMENYGASGKQ